MADALIPEKLQAFLNYSFKDPTLYLQAITHSSYANEHPPERSNELLAFLGDAVFGLVVAHVLWVRHEGMGVGGLTQRRAEIVSGKALARVGEAIGLGECLRLGKGEEQSGGRTKESLLAEAVEALVGALYLDGGLPVAEAFVLRLMALAESSSSL
jgi:ribonuclease-3